MRDLTRANQLIAKLAKENKFISPITPDDFDLFQKFFKKERHTYGNSWTYITQGMYGIGENNLGYKYYDGENLSAVCVYPKLEHPDIHAFYWIRPMGTGILNAIEETAKKLKKDQDIPTYAKKIFEDQYAELLKKGFSDISKFPWHTKAPAEDDTYPELIFSVDESLKKIPQLPRRKDIKRTYLKVIELWKNNKISFSSQSFNIKAWEITEKFFNSPKMRNKTINLSNKYDYYNMIFNNHPKEETKRELVYVNNLPLGFFITKVVNEKYLCIYATIIPYDSLKYLSDLVMLHIFRDTKTYYINKGGSENEGLYNFKLKYLSQTTNQMFWSVYF